MIVYPNAKINLGLQVLAKRVDGYHDLDTVFYPVNLQDALEVHVCEGEASYRLHLIGMPVEGSEADNLVVKAYCLLKEKYALPPVDIHLFKHIPTGAGLGGGSSDAAFMLRLLDERFELHLTEPELAAYATRLGADCPFFLKNKPMLAGGIGERLSPVSVSLKGMHIVIVKPDVSVSTREAFAGIAPHRPERTVREAIAYPVEEWKHVLLNDFEPGIFKLHPEIGALKERMYALGAIYAAMSGSGSAVYGLFKEHLEDVESHFKNLFCRQRELQY